LLLIDLELIFFDVESYFMIEMERGMK